MYWAEIAIYNSKERHELLSQFLNEAGFENKVEFIETTPAGFEDALIKCLEKYDAVRVGRGLGHFVVKQFNNVSAVVNNLQSADTLVHMSDKWWLRSSLFHGMQRCFGQVGNRFDIQSSALVVGAGPAARIACAVLIQVGFKRINISNKFVDQAKELIADLKKRFFDIEFNLIPKEQLITLAGVNGVLVNTTPNTPENDILTELFYLNFLKRPGVVLDFELSPSPTPLIAEAQEVGAHVVSGCELVSWSDQVWVEWCLSDQFDRLSYLKLLEKHFSQEN